MARQQRFLVWRPVILGVAWMIAVLLIFAALIVVTFSQLRSLTRPG